MDAKEMRLLVENYNSNLAELEKIQEKIKCKRYNTKIIAAYGHNTGGGGNSFSSKVENKAIEQNRLDEQLKEYKLKVNIVIYAEKVLTNAEKEVIEILKLGFTNKISVIAKLMHKKYKYVLNTRNKAIKKMCDFIGDKYEV